ncbi:phage holin family protein [Nocardioides sp. Iso805N]|uniref:phage holin family protein n=1 Tax=Nocardioides sp. Iso805N TaxID=1283287 RepID=UPI00036E5F06|nr:phage holin family protein [Nocardioides sp. Iso805N]
MRFVSWLAVNAVALAVVLWLIPGIYLDGPTQGWDEIRHKIPPLLVVAVILGAVSKLIKPVLTILSLPLIILTLGLFLLVVNAAMLGLTAWLLGPTRVGFHVDGFWPAVWGGLIFAIAGFFARGFLTDERR